MTFRFWAKPKPPEPKPPEPNPRAGVWFEVDTSCYPTPLHPWESHATVKICGSETPKKLLIWFQNKKLGELPLGHGVSVVSGDTVRVMLKNVVDLFQTQRTRADFALMKLVENSNMVIPNV